MNSNKTKFNNVMRRKGMYLPAILIASTIFMAFATAIVALSMSNIKIANLHSQKISAMSAAEAGINYYMWHLTHNSKDYCDGTTCTDEAPYGPFHHEYKSISGTVLGSYDLYISPPSLNSNFVTIKSVGKINNRSLSRTIVATVGFPSYAKYTLLVNGSDLWVKPDEKITGTVFINNSGVYNEGEITSDVFSTETTFTSSYAGIQDGVSGPGIFGGAKIFPVTAADTNQIDVDIKNIRDAAQNNGDGDYYDASNGKGYHIVLKSNSYDLYLVKKYDATGYDITEETLLGNHSYPSSGIIVAEDNLWVNGSINNQKITIVAADPEANPNSKKRIIIPDSIKYSNYNGSDKIGLVAQTNILTSKNAPSNMEIDAAMIAKDGQIRSDDYGQTKNNIKVYGSMAHNGGLLWSEYQTSDLINDPNNVLNPPPEFPTTGSYAILSWREE